MTKSVFRTKEKGAIYLRATTPKNNGEWAQSWQCIKSVKTVYITTVSSTNHYPGLRNYHWRQPLRTYFTASVAPALPRDGAGVTYICSSDVAKGTSSTEAPLSGPSPQPARTGCTPVPRQPQTGACVILWWYMIPHWFHFPPCYGAWYFLGRQQKV